MSKVIPLILALLLPLVSCGNRTTTPPDAGTSVRQEPSQPGSEQQTAIDMVPVQNAAPATMTAANPPEPKAKVEAPAVIQPSRSLAGHDRFLVTRPFGSVGPADFEIGLLLDRNADPRLGHLLIGLTQAFKEKTLKAAAFSAEALMLAGLLYDSVLVSAPEITGVRFSEIRLTPGAGPTLGIRLFSETGSAQGLAILGTDDEDNWLVEHLDLDLAGLQEKAERSILWDPYGYSRNLFD